MTHPLTPPRTSRVPEPEPAGAAAMALSWMRGRLRWESGAVPGCDATRRAAAPGQPDRAVSPVGGAISHGSPAKATSPRERT